MVLREVVKITGPEVLDVRLLPDAKRREVVSNHTSNTEGPGIFTTSGNKPCCICLTIPPKYFTDKQVKNVRNYN